MKKITAIVLVLAFAAFGALAFSVQGSASVPAESLAAENSAVPVKTLYARNCARCHGADGKSETELGQTMDAPNLTEHKSSLKHNIQIITNGEGAMPGFSKKLKKAEINALANYVRKL